jgi:type IV pilus assembly protein PilM
VMIEAGRLSPFDMSEVEIDYEVLEENKENRQMKVLMVAAKHDIIYGYVDCMNEAGLRPTIIDVDLFALINIYGLNYDLKDHSSSILVNIGMESTDAVFMQNGAFHSSRDIPVTGTQFAKNLETIGIDNNKIHSILNGSIDPGMEIDRIIGALNSSSREFANAMGVAVSYFQSSDGIDHIDVIVLAGGFSRIPGLANILELRTGAEVILLDPLKNVVWKDAQASDREKTGTMLAVAMGLAIRN